jgi:hypothetical protein
VVVRVTLVRSGGLAGLDLVATVDSTDLSGDQQKVVSMLLTKDLRGKGVNRPCGADQFSYQLEIQAGDSTVRRHWQEPDVHEAVRPLLAALTRQAKPAR